MTRFMAKGLESRVGGVPVHIHVLRPRARSVVDRLCTTNQHEVGLHEGVRVVPDHDRLTLTRGDPQRDRAGLPLVVVERAGAVEVLDVDDRDAAVRARSRSAACLGRNRI